MNQQTTDASTQSDSAAQTQLLGVAEEAAADAGTLSLDVVFDLLSSGRRRETLHYLQAHEGKGRLDELAEHIAALENGIEVHELNAQQRKRVYIGLYQCHLPKMDSAGVINYEQSRGTIELLDAADRLFPHLEIESDRVPSRKSSGGLLSSVFSRF